MTCSNCQGILSPTGTCFQCGTHHRRFDTFSFWLGMSGIALYFLLAIAARAIISAFNLGTAAVNIIAVLSFLIPLSTAADAIIVAVKRRKTHKTAAGLILGIAGLVIVITGVVLLLRGVIAL